MSWNFGPRVSSPSAVLALLFLYFAMTDSLINSKDIYARVQLDPNKKMSSQKILNEVSKLFQKELDNLQRPKDCNAVDTLLCGHTNPCGLVCQLHHRAVCVMYSYALGIPLIHAAKDNWPFKKSWKSTFRHLGSECKPNNRTRLVNWIENSGDGSKRKQNPRNPLRNGIVIRKELADIVEQFHPQPFLWFVGQFMKYTMRLSNEHQKIMVKAKKEFQKKYPMKYSSHTVGVHIRRTDKMEEVKHSNQPLKKYLSEAAHYFNQYFWFENKPRTVVIASDDHLMVKKAKKEYEFPKWDIRGFNWSKTLKTQDSRQFYLSETLRDFLILAESNYIVCGFSSHVCRLLLEIKATTQLNATSVFKSVDDDYCFANNDIYIPAFIKKESRT